MAQVLSGLAPIESEEVGIAETTAVEKAHAAPPSAVDVDEKIADKTAQDFLPQGSAEYPVPTEEEQ